MKRHILGFGLFSLIIAASAIALVYFQPFDIYDARDDQQRIAEFPVEEIPALGNGAKITQAVINSETGQIDLEIAFDKRDGFDNGVHFAALYFYLNDGEGKTKIVGREKIRLQANDYESARAAVRIKNSLSRLDKPDTFENLYVMIQPVAAGAEIQKFTPRFNANLAKPVLLYSGQR
jgi:hypothetical protein